MLARLTRAMAAVLLLLSAAMPAAAATTDAAPVTTGPPPAAETAPFKDVPAWHWAAGAIRNLASNGVIRPGAQGLFHPAQPIKRAELFKMILAARRKDTSAECQAMFRDVPCNAWYAPAAENAYRMAIADGVDTDIFGPDIYVNRQQLFTMLVRGVGRRWDAENQGWSTVSARLAKFKDAAQISEWARAPVALAVADSIAQGYEDGSFRPFAPATRAEAAALVNRVLVAEDGLQTAKVDGHTLAYTKVLDMSASMFSTEPGLSSHTYTGVSVRPGAVAVDPKVIPLGRLLYVEGYGYGVAADIGGAIKGNRIDLFTWNVQDAIHSGVRPVRVWVLP